MLSNLLHAKLVWMPSICYNSNYYLQNSVYFYLVPFLLLSIANLLAYVAALFVTSVCRLLDSNGVRLQFSRSQVRSPYVAKFY